MNTRFAVLLLLFPVSAYALPIGSGGVTLEIPTPSGFVPVTESGFTPHTRSLKQLQGLLDELVPPANRELVSFIDHKDFLALQRGRPPELERRFSAQVAKKHAHAHVSRSDFQKLHSTITAQNQEMMDAIDAELPGHMDRISKGLTRQLDVETALSISDTIMLPPHEISDRAVAWSMYVTYATQFAGEGAGAYVATATMAIAELQGRLVFFYTFGGEDDLEWGRAFSRSWVDTALAHNPSNFATSIGRTAWGRALLFGLVFGLLGAAAGGIEALRQRRLQKRKDASPPNPQA